MADRPPGLYRVHKPKGPSSASVTRTIAQSKCSHAGTLDPFAEGLLLVLVGSAARLIELFHEAPKTYVARIAWGVETSTGDLLGEKTAGVTAAALEPQSLEAALRRFLGWTAQIPPATSAKKLGGEPAYKKAHRGEAVVLPPSPVYLHAARFLAHELPHASTLELVCRGGFYVRSLARDLGRSLGCGAHLTGLARPRIGPWEDTPGAPVAVPREQILPWLPSCTLSDAQMGEVKRNRPISATNETAPTWTSPPGFPPPRRALRAFHLGRLVTILEPAAADPERWTTRFALGRGI